VDEVGYLPLDRAGPNIVFQLVSRRYERGTMIITSSNSFDEWGGVLGDDVLAIAILDRLLHCCDVILLVGRYRRVVYLMQQLMLGRDPSRSRTRERADVKRRYRNAFADGAAAAYWARSGAPPTGRSVRYSSWFRIQCGRPGNAGLHSWSKADAVPMEQDMHREYFS
jgi:hypothetical protein